VSQDTDGGEFARLLRELKDRSGHSYGTLSKRLHMSTSTLHRYCNGDAVPTDYAPVERLARLCKASPEELVELHRSWVLADAGRARKGGEPQSTTPADVAELPSPEGLEPSTPEKPGPIAPRKPEVHRRRRAVLAGIAVIAVAGAVALTTNLPSPGADDGRGSTAGSTAVTDQGKAEAAGSTASGSPSGASPSMSPSASRGAKGAPESTGAAATKPSAPATSGVPLTVTTQPYTWEDPCSQHYLIDKPPAEVAPPPLEPDAPAWVAASGAVSAGQQFVTLTVQGSGRETVVLNSLSVRMADKRVPPAWNDYAMGYPGVGCGGGVPTHSFTIALDAARPAVQPKAGQRNFPFKVSESDPEVFYITADATAYDVRWYLELTWSAGSRSGTLTIDDHGRPFRTSGNSGRPDYEYPLGGDGWVKAGSTS
jgi:plasmid maintenance system antidote protein VapI